VSRGHGGAGERILVRTGEPRIPPGCGSDVPTGRGTAVPTTPWHRDPVLPPYGYVWLRP
jgi:hypothetical protein